MRQFDLYANPSDRTRSIAPYLVVLQSHHLEGLTSVIVAPLIRDALRPLSAIDLEVEVGGEPLLIPFGEMFGIDRAVLRSVAGSLAQREDDIRRALERVFTGF